MPKIAKKYSKESKEKGINLSSTKSKIISLANMNALQNQIMKSNEPA